MRYLDIKCIDIEKIHENVNQPRETFDQEELEQMSKSIEKIGLLNPITVRSLNGDYQIVAGVRRFRVLKMLGKKEIQAKVVDANDIESDIMSIAENYHRKDLTVEEREKSIYAAWKRGKINMFQNKISVMSEWTGIKLETLQTNIASGKEKEFLKSDIIQKATARDLERTRPLQKIAPDIRIELLKLEQSDGENKISAIDLESIVGAIKAAKDTNTSEDVIKDIPRLISEKKIKPNQTEEFVKTIAEIPQSLQKEIVDIASKEKVIEPVLYIEPMVKALKRAKEVNLSEDIIKGIPKLISENKIKPIQTEQFVKVVAEAPSNLQKKVIEMASKEKDIEPDRVQAVVKVLKDSPPDIQNKLLKKEIEIEEAKIANVFPREEQRNQVIEDHRKMEDDNKKDFEKYLTIRTRQAKDIEQGKVPSDITMADIELFKKINANSFEQQDLRMLQFYRNRLLNLILKAEDIRSMHFDANKNEAIEIVWKIYERAYKVLVELGEIKVFGNIDYRRSPVPPK